MASVKVRKVGISIEEATDVLQHSLGEGYRVEPGGEAEVHVRKGFFGRAKVNFREEAGGTLFEVQGQGFTPAMIVLSLGLAKRTAAAIDSAPEFRDDH